MLILTDIMNKLKKQKTEIQSRAEEQKPLAAGKWLTTVYFSHSEVASLFVVPSVQTEFTLCSVQAAANYFSPNLKEIADTFCLTTLTLDNSWTEPFSMPL